MNRSRRGAFSSTATGWAISISGFLLLVVGMIRATAQQGRVAEAELFVVRDREGNVRGMFGLPDENGAVPTSLRILDRKGNERFSLMEHPIGFTQLSFHDSKENSHIRLVVSHRNAAEISVSNNMKKEHAILLFVDENDKVGIYVSGKLLKLAEREALLKMSIDVEDDLQ